MNDNLAHILGIELVTSAQGLDFRKENLKPLTTSSSLNRVLEELRLKVPFLKEDRILAHDLGYAATLIQNGKLIKAAGKEIFPNLE